MSRYIPKATRALDIWRSIEGNPTIVTFRTTAGATLPAQTVRLEYLTVQEADSAAGQGAERKLFIFGVKDHPQVADTNIKAGYRFNYLNKQYTVWDVEIEPGGGQVRAEVRAT